MNVVNIIDEQSEPGTDPTLTKNGNGRVLIQLIDLTHCKLEEVNVRMDQIVSPDYPLQNLDEKHSKKVPESMHVQD